MCRSVTLSRRSGALGPARRRHVASVIIWRAKLDSAMGNPDGVRIPLEGDRSYVVVHGDMVEIYIAYLFGSRPMKFALSDSAVVERDKVVQTGRRPPAELVARTRVAIVPTSLHRPLKNPSNLAIVFAKPVELPAVRLLARLTPGGLDLQRPKKGLGRSVNGLFLFATHPEDATAALVDAGVTRLVDIEPWVLRNWGE